MYLSTRSSFVIDKVIKTLTAGDNFYNVHKKKELIFL